MIIESINLFDFERMSFDNKVKEHERMKTIEIFFEIYEIRVIFSYSK